MLAKPRLLQPLGRRLTSGRIGLWRAAVRREPATTADETRAATPRPCYWARISPPPMPLELTRRLSTSTTTNDMTATIDSETLKQYLADSPPTVVPLTIKPHFDALSDKEKLYAHHLSV